jgi:hypothetical protein
VLTVTDRKILTADGYEVTVGDRVLNYYDNVWGVIVQIDDHPQPDTMKGQTTATPVEEWDNYWFRLDNGDILDGSRIIKHHVEGS